MFEKVVLRLLAGALLSLALLSVPVAAEKLPEHLRSRELGVPAGPATPGLAHRVAVQLTNGVPVTGLSGAAGEELFFTLEVPAGARDLAVRLRGGTGDADLYVNHGSAPTLTSYDCRPFQSNSEELCTFSAVQEGTWHVMVRGYEAFAGVELVAEYIDGPQGKELHNGVPVTDLAGGYDDELVFFIDVPAGADPLLLSVALYDGVGSVDLYVRHESSSSYTCYDYAYYGSDARCLIPSAQPGVWYIRLAGFGGFNGRTLLARWETLSGGTELVNGVPMTDLSGSYGSEQVFYLQVPDHADSVRFELSGGTGDADLVVRRGAMPTSSTADCRPGLAGNDEVCTFTPSYYSPDLEDIWFVLLEGFTSYSGVSLEGTYTTPRLFGDGFETGSWGSWAEAQP